MSRRDTASTIIGPEPLIGPKAASAILSLVSGDLEAVERVFASQLDSEIPVIREMGRYVREGGGKRLRPALHLLAGKAAGCGSEKRIALAAVFELIHTATLVHDDVIDEASTRRGRPSLNAARGNTVTVLMGDFLYLQSVQLTLTIEDLDVLRFISRVTAQMIEGELLQVTKNFDLGIGEEDYLDITRRKTAYLFAACCQTAAMLARSPGDLQAALYEYGLNLGMAFQLIDDLLDFTADEKVLGKPVLSDFGEGKVTLPLIHALREATPSRRQLLEELLSKVAGGDGVPGTREAIARMVRELGGIEATQARARAYADAAREALAALGESDARSALQLLPNYVLYRDR